MSVSPPRSWSHDSRCALACSGGNSPGGSLPRHDKRKGYLMAVTVKLPTQLRDAAGGAVSASVEGQTVGEALEALYTEHGELRTRISDENGGLRRVLDRVPGGGGHPLLRGAGTPRREGGRGANPPPGAGGRG